MSVLFGAALAAVTGAAQAEVKTQWVEYTHGETKLKGYLAYGGGRGRSRTVNG